MRKEIWTLSLIGLGFIGILSGLVAATPVYTPNGKYIVGANDYEANSAGMWAYVSGTFYLPPAFGYGGYLTDMNYDYGPQNVVGMELFPLYLNEPQYDPHTHPNEKEYGPGAYLEMKVVCDFYTLYAEIDEYDAEYTAMGAV